MSCSQTCFRNFVIFLFFTLCQIGYPISGFAQTDHCDPLLPQSDINDPLGYHPREERCEGMYIQEVSSKTLVVASLTEFFEEYDLDIEDDIIIEWTVPAEGEVRLRAQGIEPKFFYRMDSVRPAGESSFQWQTGILSRLNVLKSKIGVIGWIKHSINGEEKNIYLPLRIWQKEKITSLQPYQMIILPEKELEEVYISLANVQPDGKKQFIVDEEPLEYGYYPAAWGVDFDLPELQEPGIYYLEVAVDFRGGGSETIGIWLYHDD